MFPFPISFLIISLTIAVELERGIFMGYLKLFCDDAGKYLSFTPWLGYIKPSVNCQDDNIIGEK